MKLAGRKEEIKLLQSLLPKETPEFVAIYGRRRVGKTFLIRQAIVRENVCYKTFLFQTFSIF